MTEQDPIKNGLMITLNIRLITNNHVGMILHLI